MVYISKKIKFSIGAVVFVVAVSITTVFLLKKFVGKAEPKPGQTAVNIKAVDIIRKFNDNPPRALSSDVYNQQLKTIATVNYKLIGHKYEVSLSTDNSVTMSLRDVDKHGDDAAIRMQVANFMDKLGLRTSDYDLYGAGKEFKYRTYVGKGVVCQSLANQDQASFYQLACVDQQDISKKYTEIDKYLAIYDKKIDFDQALIQSGSKDNLAYAIVSLNADKQHNKLLFAAVSDKWAYLGDLLAGGKQYSNGKFSITPDLQKRISDAKYKGYLDEVLAKG